MNSADHHLGKLLGVRWLLSAIALAAAYLRRLDRGRLRRYDRSSETSALPDRFSGLRDHFERCLWPLKFRKL